MKQRIFYTILFLVLNFTALGIGVYLMDGGPLSDWYIQLNQAPWTPPNPTFGIAWSIIMICFAFYMSNLILKNSNRNTIWIIYIIQWILNTGWNYTFFNQHLPILGLINLLILFGTVSYLLFNFSNTLKRSTYLILPYILWLIVAISLNSYIVIYNN